MSGVIDLSADDLTIVRDVLRRTLPPGARAYVFGSRATRTAWRYSDLDLAVECDTPLGFDVLGAVTEALSESDLPIKVDVVDLLAVEPRFRALIEADLVPLGF